MHRISLPSLALTSLLLAACGKAPDQTHQTPAAAPAPVSAAPSPTPAQTETTCPATDFDRFLPLFANDVAVQKAFVTDPLQSDSVDPNADPEPKPVSKMLAKAEVAFPVMPGEQQQAKDGLTSSKTPTGPNEVVVKLAKGDTDYQMSFFFRNDGCWHLYRIKDDSL